MDKRTAGTLGTLAGMLVLALVWWLLPGGGGDDGGSAGRSDATSSASSSASVGASAGASVRASSGNPSGRSSDGSSTDPASGLPYVDEAALPVQAQQTLRLIDAGGPFPYPDHDGSVFGNYEGILPAESRGYYTEYTVKDPAESDRGPWRIIAGSRGELYWTDDHYASFSRIVRS